MGFSAYRRLLATGRRQETRASRSPPIDDILGSGNPPHEAPGPHSENPTSRGLAIKPFLRIWSRIPSMSPEWCCADFQARCFRPGKREEGIGILVLYGPRSIFRCLLEYRRPNRTPLEPIAEDGIALKFCPWCGCNLLECYGSGLPPFQNH
jgi:hypothetical protein